MILREKLLFFSFNVPFYIKNEVYATDFCKVMKMSIC